MAQPALRPPAPLSVDPEPFVGSRAVSCVWPSGFVYQGPAAGGVGGGTVPGSLGRCWWAAPLPPLPGLSLEPRLPLNLPRSLAACFLSSLPPVLFDISFL